MISSNNSRSPRLLLAAPFLNLYPLLLAGGGIHPGISKAVNLAIFLGFLYLVLRKPVRKFFSERLAQVRATLEQAAKEKNAASAKMAELDDRLSRLDAELAEIRIQAQREAAAERERMNQLAQHDQEKLRLMAEREVEAAKQIALADLREFAANQAVDLAEQMIRRELKPEDDARLLHRVGEELSRAK